MFACRSLQTVIQGLGEKFENITVCQDFFYQKVK